MEVGACSCDFDYDWIAEIHTEKEVTARKEHSCLECDAKINVGDKYTYVFQAGGDNETFEGHFCIPCERIRKDFCAPYGMLRAQVWEYLGFDYVTGEEYDDE